MNMAMVRAALTVLLVGAVGRVSLAQPQETNGEPETPASGAAAGKDDKPKWNVDAPTGTPSAPDAAIDVDEGTWVNLDVSPDGAQIAFDLLGDLYTIPIEGGEATAVTT